MGPVAYQIGTPLTILAPDLHACQFTTLYRVLFVLGYVGDHLFAAVIIHSPYSPAVEQALCVLQSGHEILIIVLNLRLSGLDAVAPQ